MPSEPRMPPLAMLRAFEAAARHGSMSRAAAELNVTHGAISRQVVALERFLGAALFSRKARGVTLTVDGATLFHGVGTGFERIRAAVDALQRPDQRLRRVTVTTLPSLASRWLVPQLAEFQARHPDIEVHVHTAMELRDLTDPRIDFAIRYGDGAWPGLDVRQLLTVNAFPLSSPDFLLRHGTPKRPQDLLRLPLIHNVTKQWWIDWFVAAGLRPGDLSGGIIVDEYGLALELAQQGHGVVLGRDPLTRRDMASGALVRLLDVSFTPRFAYYLVRDPRRTPGREAGQLMDWLTTVAAERGTFAVDPLVRSTLDGNLAPPRA